MEYIDWDLAERTNVGIESFDKDLSWDVDSLSSTADYPVKDALQSANHILSPYHTFASVSGCVPISSPASTPDMASPLSISSSLDSIWTTGSLSTPPAAPNPPRPIAEPSSGWLSTSAKSMGEINTTNSEALLVSRAIPNAPAPAIPFRNASSTMASDREGEPLTSPGPSTPSFSACSTRYIDEISDGSLAIACRKLRHLLRAQHANTKPPGDLFGPFIRRLRKQNHCRLCPKVLDNREQMNQHIMKDHCDHRPFACPVQGCNHRDARHADLRKHLEKHSNVRWPCPACQKPFANKRNLVRHIHQLHPKFEHELVARKASRRRARRY